MKYWLLIVLLALLPQQEAEWEITYIAKSHVLTANLELAELFTERDSVVVNIFTNDTIKSHHYEPKAQRASRIYHMYKDEVITINPITNTPIIGAPEPEDKYAVDWESILEKTGNTKTILGYECVEYVGKTLTGREDHQMETTAQFWIYELPDTKKRNLRATII